MGSQMPDELDRILTLFNAITGWSAEKYRLRDELAATAKKLGFFHFKGRAEYFSLKRLPHIGEAASFTVPLNHRGKLKDFKGKTVKVICIGNIGTSDRQLIAYEPSNDNPKH